MANGIGRVWAANAGDDEQRPNGVGSVWIENIDALAPSGGASEEQINELSAAIDYVSANAGDPNALTGYQEDGCEISATSSFFGAKGEAGYVISTDPGKFEAKGPSYDLTVGYGSHLTANNSCSAKFENGCSAVFTNAATSLFANNSNFINTNYAILSSDGDAGFVASGKYHDFKMYGGHLTADNGCSALFTNAASAVFTNGSQFINTNNALISGDGSNGFVTSSNYHDLRIERAGKISANNNASAVFTNGSQFINTNNAFISADGNKGFLFSSNYSTPIILRDSYNNITLGNNNNGYTLNADTPQYSAWIDNYGFYGLSGSNYIGSFGGWQGSDANPIARHYKNGVGFSAGGTNFGVSDGGTLIAYNYGKLSATNGASAVFNNSCSALFTNGSRTEITNGHTLLVGNNELGTMNGILVSGNSTPYISIFNGGRVKVTDGNEVYLSSCTHKIGTSLNASGSQFVSADGEDVSAWKPATMTVMGAYNQTSSNAAFVIGNGSATTARSDLFVIDYSGNAKSNDFVAVPPERETLLVASSTQLYSDPNFVSKDIINSADVGSDSLDTTFKMDVSFVDDITFGTGQSIGITVNPLGYFIANSKNDLKALSSFKITELSSTPGWSFTRSNDVDSWSGMKWRFFRAVTISPDPYNVGVSAYQKEQPVPVSVTALYNAFTAYTASHP